jgi:TRAP-type C4-dicarboxylate transport system permease small subunit
MRPAFEFKNDAMAWEVVDGPYGQKLLDAFTAKTGLIIEKICGAVCVLCFATMTLVAIMGVFSRYIMQSPFMWIEEVARYLLVWMGFTAINIALRQNRHIKVEIIAKLVPAAVAKIIGYLVDALIACFFIVLLQQGYLLTVNNMMAAATCHLSMSWILIAVPAAAALSLIQLFLGVVKKIFSEFAPPSEALD